MACCFGLLGFTGRPPPRTSDGCRGRAGAWPRRSHAQLGRAVPADAGRGRGLQGWGGHCNGLVPFRALIKTSSCWDPALCPLEQVEIDKAALPRLPQCLPGIRPRRLQKQKDPTFCGLGITKLRSTLSGIVASATICATSFMITPGPPSRWPIFGTCHLDLASMTTGLLPEIAASFC